jgi:hypothetical protein
MHGHGQKYWGLAWPALAWLERNVSPGMTTLETGAGGSTVVFAANGASHVAISPAPAEHEQIRKYCKAEGIGTQEVSFIAEPSHTALLDSWTPEPLDLVLIDGAHAFPYPILDWFYTERHVRVGGHVLDDDAQLPSINSLASFLRESPSWKLTNVISYRTLCFRKLDDVVPTFFTQDLAFDKRPRFNYLSPPRRLLAEARYRLLDPRGPLSGLAKRLVRRRSRS